VLSERDWSSFDRIIDVIERAYIERARRRAESLLARWPDDDRDAFLADLVADFRSSRAFADDAWRLALAMQRTPVPGEAAAVVDLRERVLHTTSP
jgi:hypothetical protein